GRKRFLLFTLSGAANSSACATPALAWIDTPAIGAGASGNLPVAGWAFKDGAGVAAIELMLDGRIVSATTYGSAEPKVAAYWKISSDPQQPNVGFRGNVDLSAVAPGRYWLGLRI